MNQYYTRSQPPQAISTLQLYTRRPAAFLTAPVRQLCVHPQQRGQRCVICSGFVCACVRACVRACVCVCVCKFCLFVVVVVVVVLVLCISSAN